MTKHGHIPFEGIHNFRDLGGYETADGRKIRRGMLYRSGHLAAYTDDDMDRLKKLAIKTIVDFRTEDEIAMNPDPTIDGVRYIHDPAVKNGQVNADLKSLSTLNPERMMQFYDQIPVKNATYRRLFRLLLQDEPTPLLMHCTGGKDRTGGAAALLLLTLGVPMETVMEDYLATNIYLEDFTNQLVGMYRMMMDEDGLATIRAMLRAEAKYLETTMARISAEYGDFETYLREDLGISAEDEKLLKERYLEQEA